MSENRLLALIQSWLGSTAAEGPALADELERRLILGISSVDSVGKVTFGVNPGGITVATGTHALLSATHSDTTAAAVARGDLVIGQGATPTWQRRALGAAGTYPRSDGVDLLYSALLVADLSGIVAAANGGTGNGFTRIAGPATTEKTFTLPNATATILTDNAAVTVPQGGTGRATLAANGVVLGAGTAGVTVSGAGTSGQVLTSNGAGADPTFQTAAAGPFKGYTATLADVANTAAETDCVSITVPANDLANGDWMTWQMLFLGKNNKGTTGTVTFKFYWGTPNVTLSNVVGGWSNNAAERTTIISFTMVRFGADLKLYDTTNSTFTSTAAANLNGDWPAATTVPLLTIAAPTFTASQTVKLTVTLSAADATFYVKPQSARILRQSAT